MLSIIAIVVLTRQRNHVRDSIYAICRGEREEQSMRHKERDREVMRRAAILHGGACPHRSRVRKLRKARWCIRRGVVLYMSTARYRKYVKKVEGRKKRHAQTCGEADDTHEEDESSTVANNGTTEASEVEACETKSETSTQTIAT